jgi:dTDP-4-dehydrorhamnose reductase
VVEDEVGSPTYTTDVAAAIVQLLDAAPRGIYHLANDGSASRLDAARLVLKHCRPDVRVQAISRTAFVRASNPPAWAVLDCARAARTGVRLRRWEEALEAYAAYICS